MRWLGYVSLEPVRGYLVRFHPSGKGKDSPHSFSVVVADVEGQWWFKGAAGRYSKAMAKAIRYALSRAGFPRVRRLSGYGARERIITMEALAMKDLIWRGDVSFGDKRVGYQENGWYALPPEDVVKMQEMSKDCVAACVASEKKNAGKGYAIDFSGVVIDTETGERVVDTPVRVELDAEGLVKHLKEAKKLSDFMIDWAADDVQHGKKKGWEHEKAKPKPPKPKELGVD